MTHSDIWQQIRHEIEGRLIYRTRDELGELFVVDHKEHRLLYFGAPYEQSCISRDKPHQPVHEYARAMLMVLAWAQPERVLMLGLGGGTLVHAVKRAFPPTELTIIELRAEVADVARHYFQLEHLTNTDIIIADAKQQARAQPADTYDILFADLFTDNRMHPWQQQHKFFVQCQRLLRDHGWLVINFDQYQDDPCLNSLCTLFPTVLSLHTRDGNHVVLASKQPGFDPDDHTGPLERLEHQLEVSLQGLFAQLMILSG